MTTTSRNYYYEYEILQMIPMPTGFRVRIGDIDLPVLGLALVDVTILSAIDSSRVDIFKDLRYIICDIEGNPCVNYKENPDYKGVK